MEWANEHESNVTYEEAVSKNESRILFAGPRRSGKTSIERVIFHKMSPHETLFLESTQNVDISLISNNHFVRFQTWDFGGDMNLHTDIIYAGRRIPISTVFKNCSTLIYVIDAQEEDFEDSLPKLIETISVAYSINPKINFEIFLHKIDGDSIIDEIRVDRQQAVQQYLSTELSDTHHDINVSYHLTSIYDHSTLEAFSKVVQKLVPQLPTLNNLLDMLISSCNIEKSYLVDVRTKLYIATDTCPVDVHTYELCADLVDVVIDVSWIYGMKPIENYHNSNSNNSTKGDENSDHTTQLSSPNTAGTGGGGAGGGHGLHQLSPYDEDSTSAIRLNNGMILYLREVSEYIALVCVLREEYFVKRSILDYNIDCLKQSLNQIIQRTHSTNTLSD